MERQQLDKSREEIDLIHLFNYTANTVGRFFQLLASNLLTFLGTFMLVGGLVYAFQYFRPRSFATKAVFVSRFLPGSYCDFLVNGINDDIKDQNFGTIATNLHVSRKVAGDIMHISSTAMARDSGALYKDDPDATLFQVRLVLRRNENLDSIQQGLVHYLEDNNFAIARKAMQRKSLTALIERLTERMQSLDSLKKSLNNRYANAAHEQGIIFGEPADPVSVYKEDMNYYKERVHLNERLSNLDNTIEVFDPFVKQEVRNYPNIRPVLWISIVAGLLAALIITPLYALKREKRKH